MAISHTHPDHIGNVELFPQVMLYVQKAEYEWPGADGAPRFLDLHHLYQATAWLTNVALHFRAQQPLDPSNINGLCHIPPLKV
jgi:glyoxylase-like metal-dependent hydrolase (beta-lactamase superfamily II)